MKRTLAVLATLTVGTVGLANAESQANIADAPENPLATPRQRPQAEFRFVDPALTPNTGDHVSAAVSNVIYLNNCKPNGCQIAPGYDSSISNASSIPQQNSTVAAFAYSDTVWNQVVDCVKQTYAPFAVQIVTDRPASGNYHMAIVAGTPGNVQEQNGVGGVSPFTCGYINNAISFSFANIYGPDVDQICWTVAQETAHSWGLDHKFDNKDPMTYLDSGPTRKAFQNATGSCGEYSARTCSCGGASMNSFTKILQTFGGNTPTPPTVAITAPHNGDNVDVGFPIRADITDDISVSKAELRIDGNLVSTLMAAPWVWNAPATLGQGNHIIKVTGYDVSGTPTDATITIARGKPCSGDSSCPDAGNVCLAGRCVKGPDAVGGLGTTCTDNTQCSSGQCANDGTTSYCVEACVPSSGGCPSGFGCVTAGTGGVCWPGAGGGDGGCNSGRDGAESGVILFGFGLGALLVTRRRRRA